MSALRTRTVRSSPHATPVADDIIRHDMMSTRIPLSRTGTGTTPDVRTRGARDISHKDWYPIEIFCATISAMFVKAPLFNSQRAMRVETPVSMLWGRPYEAAGVIRNCAVTRTEHTPHHIS